MKKAHTSGKDLRDSVPDLRPYLDPADQVISVKKQDIILPKKVTDYHDVLCHLCNVKKIKDLGKKGPPMASTALRGNRGVASVRKYEAVFGRDSLYMSDHLLDEFPDLVRTTLLYLASVQGVDTHVYREEEYGRIPHEVRDPQDPIAAQLTKELKWQWPYYATIDATLLFIRVLYRYCTTTKEGLVFLNEKYMGRDKKTHTMQVALERAVVWLIGRMDQNFQGFVETKAGFAGSHIVQSLQDSHTGDSLFHEKGGYANSEKGIAPIEVQGQAYDALLYAAELFLMTKQHAKLQKNLRARAKEMRKQILKLWVKDTKGNYFAAGTDRDTKGALRPLKIRKAIAAFLLNTELFTSRDTKIVEQYIQTLFSDNFLTAGGIRNLAQGEVHYAPTAYHNGSAWPVITFEIARGLRKQGYHMLARYLEDCILRITNEIKIYPEFVRSDDDGTIRINTRIVDVFNNDTGARYLIERPPQLFQGWTVTAVANILFHREHNLNPETKKGFKLKPLERTILKKLKK